VVRAHIAANGIQRACLLRLRLLRLRLLRLRMRLRLHRPRSHKSNIVCRSGVFLAARRGRGLLLEQGKLGSVHRTLTAQRPRCCTVTFL
jgi:hypothetical protein